MQFLDLFRPKWKQSDVAQRLAAIQAMDPAREAETLGEIACADPDSQVRAAAVRKISDPQLLDKIAASNPDAEAMGVVAARLNEVFKDRALNSPDPDSWKNCLARINDDHVLASIVTETRIAELRLAALAKIGSEAVLGKLAMTDCGKEAELEAVARINDEDLLEKIRHHGSNNAVRHAAAEKLEQLREPKGPPAEELRWQELVALCSHAEELQNSWNFEAAAGLLAKDAAKWRELDPAGEHQFKEHFDKAIANFEQRRAKFEAQQEEEKRRLAAARDLRVEKEALCEELLSLDPLLPETPGELERLTARWKVLEPLPESVEAELNQRFVTAREKLAGALAQVQAEREEAARLEQLCVETETLAATDDWKAIKAKSKSLKWSAPEFKHLDPKPLRARFEAAGRKLRERLEDHARQVEEARRQRLEQLAKLVETVKSQVDAEDRKQALKKVHRVQKSWRELNGVAESKLANNFKQALERFYGKQQEYDAEREWDEWHNKGVKEELIHRVEATAQLEDLDAVARIIREAQAEWKQTGPASRKDAESLWQTFRAACESNYARCKAFFEEQRKKREANLERCLKLCAQAERLQDSTDWQTASNRFKQMQDEWKATGALPHKHSREAYQRFQKACNQFFERRRAHYEELEKQREGNLTLKEDLIQKAEALADSKEKHPPGACIEIQDKWKNLGPAPRDKEKELWKRFQDACSRFFKKLDHEREENLTQKQALCEELEALVAGLEEDSDKKGAAQNLLELQRRWREIGPIPKTSEVEMRQRFATLYDKFFGVRRKHFEELPSERARNLAIKEDLLLQTNALAESEDWEEAGDRFNQLEQQWQETGPAPRAQDRELADRFQAAADKFSRRHWKGYGKQHQEELDNLTKKKELCDRLEVLVGVARADGGEQKNPSLSLAEELKLAIESNFALASQGQSKVAEVRRIQASWQAVGPAPHKDEQKLWKRYKRALDKFYGQRRQE